MSVAEVVDPKVLSQAVTSGRSNGWDPVVMPVQLVDDALTLGRSEHKFLSRPARDQRYQQLHQGRVESYGALTGACLRRPDVELVLAVPLPRLVDSGGRRLGEKVHVCHG